MDARSRWQSTSPSRRPVLPSNVVNKVVMDPILISSAGLWTGALAADHLGLSSEAIATALIRGATGGPAGVASEIARLARRWGKARRPVGARAERSGPAMGRPAPTSVVCTGPSASALRRQRLAVGGVPTGLPG